MFARLIINPISGPARRGRAADRARIARRTFERLRVDVDICFTEHASHAHELAMEAGAAGAALVIAWGGDGTINEVGRALVRRAAGGPATVPAPALGIVPGGSGNGLARELEIPFDPVQALERAVANRARTIDAGEIGERLFFNVAGIGFDAHVAALVSTRVNHRGLLPYVAASARDLMNFQAGTYAIELGTKQITTAAVLIAAANSRQYGFGARIAPGASIDDGLIDLVVVDDRQLLGNLRRIPAMFTGRFYQQRGVRAFKIREASIRSSSPMLFHVDGEAVQGSDVLTVRVHPGALRLCV